ncbi:hypothetical protein [Neisseria sp. CCUG12390]|uniref:hypothetical protein n=1 Tax=Neisseria sp. CCUG12390 TaxID=3392035 RepID=UPI003A0FCC74
MKLMKTTAAAMCAVMTLNGCTMFLWGENDPFSERTTTRQAAQDEIQAFGVVRQANSQLEKGSLVMMGAKNWFVVNPEDSAKLQGVLNVKLDKAFQIVGRYDHKPLKSFPVTLKSAKSNDFTTDFCLRYDTVQADDIAKLKALSFEMRKSSEKGKETPYYVRCDTAAGKFYQSPPNYRADYRFETPFPVSVDYTVTHKSTDFGKLARNLFWTPVTLAGDAVLAVVILPFSLMKR